MKSDEEWFCRLWSQGNLEAIETIKAIRVDERNAALDQAANILTKELRKSSSFMTLGQFTAGAKEAILSLKSKPPITS